MVLVQFFIEQGGNNNNGAWHNININGPCSARLVSYVFQHSNAHIVQLQSDVFKTPYSGNEVNNRNLNAGVLISNASVFAFDQTHRDFHWNNIIIPGRVQWTVVDFDSGQQLAGNWTLILTFDIEQLP